MSAACLLEIKGARAVTTDTSKQVFIEFINQPAEGPGSTPGAGGTQGTREAMQLLNSGTADPTAGCAAAGIDTTSSIKPSATPQQSPFMNRE
eukprot:CAMPEP_0114412566 /NCGR_PEP_ID=MMETSP0103-20121206/395_1 /TAXON_ID=37642 ORGANISM="Paraphysomonas imperforata, Strain PA2" /NCGR_SAMPLE_ID=MMETSP0103 /ASSEMBLY_ACC=CAM_ASM_000201 /LENGTH=91 /DNA_ID=CAMNT_0001580593 /DNA_START=28 /DNA_END=304 /DNA_ORIENTATION=-